MTMSHVQRLVTNHNTEPPGTWPLFTRADLTWPGTDQIAHDYDAEMVSHQSERGKEQIQEIVQLLLITNPSSKSIVNSILRLTHELC